VYDDVLHQEIPASLKNASIASSSARGLSP
jgi:hypothetical protein